MVAERRGGWKLESGRSAWRVHVSLRCMLNNTRTSCAAPRGRARVSSHCTTSSSVSRVMTASARATLENGARADATRSHHSILEARTRVGRANGRTCRDRKVNAPHAPRPAQETLSVAGATRASSSST
jgi:hypothetical protein